MELRWTEPASSDLERITDYLFEHAPQRAPELIRTLYAAPFALLEFPAVSQTERGRVLLA